jgi:hypothetical protein
MKKKKKKKSATTLNIIYDGILDKFIKELKAIIVSVTYSKDKRSLAL